MTGGVPLLARQGRRVFSLAHSGINADMQRPYSIPNTDIVHGKVNNLLFHLGWQVHKHHQAGKVQQHSRVGIINRDAAILARRNPPV